MPKEKRSFFERLTGTVSLDDYDDRSEDSHEHVPHGEVEKEERGNLMEDEVEEGQLAVDVFQTIDAIVIKALVAGVKPDDLDVSITRDMVSVRGTRQPAETITEENYFYQELYWGSFSRSIVLPQEIEVEAAAASEKYGLLTITLPKLDKAKQTKLKVRAN